MAISAVRLMSLIAEAVKLPPQAMADPAKGALVKALVAPAPPTGSAASTGSTPMLPVVPLPEAMRPQQDGSVAVLRAYGFAGAAVSREVATDEPHSRAPGGASEPLSRADVPPPASRAAEQPMPNRPAPFPLQGFAMFPPVAQVDALAVKSGQRAAPKRSAPDAGKATVAADQKMSYGPIVAATAIAALIFLSLIFAA